MRRAHRARDFIKGNNLWVPRLPARRARAALHRVDRPSPRHSSRGASRGSRHQPVAQRRGRVLVATSSAAASPRGAPATPSTSDGRDREAREPMAAALSEGPRQRADQLPWWARPRARACRAASSMLVVPAAAGAPARYAVLGPAQNEGTQISATRGPFDSGPSIISAARRAALIN